MYESIFPSAETRAWISSGVGAPFVRAYAMSLFEAGFKPSTMSQHIYTAAHLVHWLEDHGVALTDLDEAVLERFRDHFLTCDCSHSRPGVHVHASAGATRFVNYLRSTGILAPVPKVSDPCTELMERFISWLTLHRGSTKSTLTQYRSHITSVLNALGTDPSRYNVGAVRQFVLTHIGSYGTSYAKAAGSKLRMFFRFLAAEGICSPDILNAVPKTANWRLTDLPRYLSADEIEQVVITPDERSRVAIRNRAVILLLARLGLRALDIVALRLSDVDWGNGLIRVMGKGRRESWLPLPQDAGDAVLEYLEKARPPSSDDHLFLKTRAPGGPFTTGSVGHIVQQALDRARVEKPTGVRTHLFRHSFARRLLAQDVPLEGIAAILRHRSIETTAKYAKIDVETLRSVVQEWMGDPEVMPC